MPLSFSNAPLCTIDQDALKASRFLIDRPPALPYRDQAGNVNVHLCEASQRELDRMPWVSADVVAQLAKWTRHAQRWSKEHGPQWTRQPASSGGYEWVSSDGQSAPELRSKDEPPSLKRDATEATSRVASRVGGAEAERRRQMMANIALGKPSGLKRSAPSAAPATTAEPSKRSKAEADEAEARERRAAEKAVKKAEKLERKEAKRAKRRADKAERRRAAAATIGDSAANSDEEEAEDDDDDDDDDESEVEEDDAEQVFEDTMAQCDKVATKMRSTLSSLVDPDSGAPPMPQPANMSKELTMAPHQLVGLSWLMGLHRHGASGILADEMGLGKTVQAISLLAQLLSEGDEGPHLVVAPTSTLENWLREFAMWCPEMRVLKYHGSEAERMHLQSQMRRVHHHVVLCTFKLFEGDSDKAKREREFVRKLGFHYVVLDEAQQIKNADSKRYKNLTAVRSPHRLLLTGTPIENSPRELLALLAFLMPSTFAAKGSMKDSLVQLFATLERAGEGQEISTQRARRIKQLMAPFVLRRLKTVVMHGLLPKTEEDMLVKMTAEQQALYVATVKRIADQARERQRAWEAEAGAGAGAGAESSPFGGEGKKWVRAAFVELRKVAQHTLLARSHYDDDIERIAYVLKCEEEFGEQATLDMVRAELRDASDLDLHLYCRKYPALHTRCLPPEALLGSGKAAKLAEMLPPLLEQGHRTLIFSQWTSTLDILELLLQHLGIRSVRFDGQTAVDERQRLIDEFNGDATIGVFLLTTRAGGLGINLTAADTVIIHDADFNPAADRQAMDRAHRMGQKRPVRVIKLASAATVDEQVLKIAATKLAQQSVLLGGDRKGKGTKGSGKDGAAGDDAEEPSEDLMGGILRDLLRSEDPSLAPPPQPDADAGSSDEAAAEPAEVPMDVEGAQDTPPEVAAAADDACAIETGEVAPAVPAVPATDEAAEVAEAAEAAPIVSESKLRDEVSARRVTLMAGTLREALDTLSAHFGVDLRAAGLKPVVKQLLKELVA